MFDEAVECNYRLGSLEYPINYIFTSYDDIKIYDQNGKTLKILGDSSYSFMSSDHILVFEENGISIFDLFTYQKIQEISYPQEILELFPNPGRYTKHYKFRDAGIFNSFVTFPVNKNANFSSISYSPELGDEKIQLIAFKTRGSIPRLTILDVRKQNISFFPPEFHIDVQLNFVFGPWEEPIIFFMSRNKSNAMYLDLNSMNIEEKSTTKVTLIKENIGNMFNNLSYPHLLNDVNGDVLLIIPGFKIFRIQKLEKGFKLEESKKFTDFITPNLLFDLYLLKNGNILYMSQFDIFSFWDIGKKELY